MTGREANSYIGRTMRYHVPDSGLEVDVRIDDSKQAYGRTLFLCIPLAGRGSAWLTLSSLKEATR